MSAIQQQHNVATSDVHTYDIWNIETWKDIAKTIAGLAAVAILPLASYLASGTLACVAVISLEIVCYLVVLNKNS